MKKLILSFIFLCTSFGCDKHCFNKSMTAEQLSKCANQGDPNAQYELGVKYEQGRDFPQDDQQAAQWYLKAAEQNDANAQYNLGLRYEQGKGVPANDLKVFEWARKRPHKVMSLHNTS